MPQSAASTPSTTRPTYRLIYIVGAGHCGSTLLNLLLNGHSDILGLSEIGSVDRVVAEDPDRPPFSDPLWTAAISRCEQQIGGSFSDIDLSTPPARQLLRWRAHQVEAWARPNMALLDALAVVGNARFLVDASKSWQRLYALSRSQRFDLKIIHLIRDGRAVTWSYFRKYRRPLFALSKASKVTIAALALERRFDTSNWLQLRYEDLARDPEATLRNVCRFLDCDFQADMLQYRDHSHVGIGGNRMAAGSDTTIVLDERWRHEMPRGLRLTYAILLGWLNRRFGYR